MKAVLALLETQGECVEDKARKKRQEQRRGGCEEEEE